MGQKTNPVGFRLGINRTWDSRWFASKEYAKWLDEDIKVRTYIKQRLFKAGVARVEIERSGGKASVNILPRARHGDRAQGLGSGSAARELRPLRP
jgi:small subunit ribosomal protein S3